MRNILKDNDLSFINIRLEDTFTIFLYKDIQQRQTIDIQTSQKWIIYMMNVKYLHSTVQIKQFQKNKKNAIVNIDNINSNNIYNYKGIFKRKLSGSGFHQKLNITIQLDPQYLKYIDITPQCTFIIQDILPSSTYIDVDQLYNVVAYEVINIEKPQHFSKQYYYKYSKKFSQINITGMNQYFFQYPIHFRYPQPQQKYQYTMVQIFKAEGAWIQCPQASNDKNNNEVYRVERYLLQQDLLNDRGVAKIPNGSIEQNRFVSFVTFLATILCALLISKQLRNR